MVDQRRPITVLCLDDEPDFADTVGSILERQDEAFEAIVETSPEAALSLLEAGDAAVDCVISDYRMPRMDGLEFLEAGGRSTRTCRSSC